MGLLGRHQSRRFQPFIHMSDGLGLPGLSQQVLPWDAGWHSIRLFAQVLSFLREALVKRGSLAESASLHDTAPLKSL